eukprot:496847_1
MFCSKELREFEYVIVGTGYALVSACKEFVRLAITKKCNVCMISSDKLLLSKHHMAPSKQSAYHNGLNLTSLNLRIFLGQQMVTKYCNQHRIHVKLNTITTNIDFEVKLITTDKGDTIKYNKLLLVGHVINVRYSLSEKQCIVRNIYYVPCMMRPGQARAHIIRSHSTRDMHCALIVYKKSNPPWWMQRLMNEYDCSSNIILAEDVHSFTGDDTGHVEGVQLQNGNIIPVHVVLIVALSPMSLHDDQLFSMTSMNMNMKVNERLQSVVHEDVVVCAGVNWPMIFPFYHGSEIGADHGVLNAEFAVRSITDTLDQEEIIDGFRCECLDIIITTPSPSNINHFPFAKMVLNTVDHLLCGYIRRSDHPFFPFELLRIISMYFRGHFLSTFLFKNDFTNGFSRLHSLRKKHLHHIAMKLLCPGDDTQHKHVLKGLIHTTLRTFLPFQLPTLVEEQKVNAINFGLVAEYTQLCDFDSVLGKDPYITKFVRNFPRHDQPMLVRFVIGVLQNKDFYDSYQNTSRFRSELVIQNAINVVSSDQFTLKQLRPFLAPFVLGIISLEDLNKIDCMMQTLIKFISKHRHAVNASLDTLAWLWLEKLIMQRSERISKQNIKHRTTLQQLLNIVVSLVMRNAIHMPQAAFNVICDMVRTYELEVAYSISFCHNVEELINSLLRGKEAHGWIGFKMLDKEIQKWKNGGNQYRHHYQLLSYVDKTVGLFQSSMVRCLRILKNKHQENIDSAKEQLDLATKVCYDINQILCSTGNDVQKFDRFYKKMKATKLLKPIIQKFDRFYKKMKATKLLKPIIQ